MICLIHSLFTLIQFLLLYNMFLHHYKNLLWTLQYSRFHSYRLQCSSIVMDWIWNRSLKYKCRRNWGCELYINFVFDVSARFFRFKQNSCQVCGCTVIQLVVATNWMQPNKKCVGSQFVLLPVNWIQSNYGEWFWYFDRLGCPNKLI